MDVLMPDGTTITGVPEGITQSELLARYGKYTSGLAPTAAPTLSPEEQAMGAIGAPSEGGIASIAKRQEALPPSTGGRNAMTADEYRAQVAAREAQGYDRTISGTALDAGITLLKGAIGLPEAFVGLADIPTLGYAGKVLEQAGYKPKEAKEILDTYLSEAQQYANRQLKETKGFLPSVGAALQNPSTIATSIVESLPQMIGGAGIARGILKVAPGVAPYLAGAAGEGILGAGAAAEQIRQESKDKLLTGKQALAALGSGAGTAAFGVAGGKLASKFGLDDIDTLLVNSSTTGGSKSVLDFAKRAAASGISEGLFEEMPQSAQETMWMNYAQDRPFMEGVAEAAAMGLVTGGAMGVGATALRGRRQQDQSGIQTLLDQNRQILGVPPDETAPTGIEPPPAPPSPPSSLAVINPINGATVEPTDTGYADIVKLKGSAATPEQIVAATAIEQQEQPPSTELISQTLPDQSQDIAQMMAELTGKPVETIEEAPKPTGGPSIPVQRAKPEITRTPTEDGGENTVATRDGTVVKDVTRYRYNAVVDGEPVNFRVEKDNKTGQAIAQYEVEGRPVGDLGIGELVKGGMSYEDALKRVLPSIETLELVRPKPIAAPETATPVAPVAPTGGPTTPTGGPAAPVTAPAPEVKPELADKIGDIPFAEYKAGDSFEQDGRTWQVESLGRHGDGLIANTADDGEPVRQAFRITAPINPQIEELVDLTNQLAKIGAAKETTYEALTQAIEEKAFLGPYTKDKIIEQSIAHAKDILAKQPKPAETPDSNIVRVETPAEEAPTEVKPTEEAPAVTTAEEKPAEAAEKPAEEQPTAGPTEPTGGPSAPTGGPSTPAGPIAGPKEPKAPKVKLTEEEKKKAEEEKAKAAEEKAKADEQKKKLEEFNKQPMKVAMEDGNADQVASLLYGNAVAEDLFPIIFPSEMLIRIPVDIDKVSEIEEALSKFGFRITDRSVPATTDDPSYKGPERVTISALYKPKKESIQGGGAEFVKNRKTQVTAPPAPKDATDSQISKMLAAVAKDTLLDINSNKDNSFGAMMYKEGIVNYVLPASDYLLNALRETRTLRITDRTGSRQAIKMALEADKQEEVEKFLQSYIDALQTLQSVFDSTSRVADLDKALREKYIKDAQSNTTSGKFTQDGLDLRGKMSANRLDALFSKMDSLFAANEDSTDQTNRVVKKETEIPPELGNIIRRGMRDHRQGRDVDVEDFVKTFGLFPGGVDFGNWVNQTERAAHLNAIYDAMYDLADVSGINPKMLGLGQKLKMAIGAQGRGGRTRAHYFAKLNEINLTKTKGDGTLGHEWQHGLDWNLQQTPGGKILMQGTVSRLKNYVDVETVENYLKGILRDTASSTDNRNLPPKKAFFAAISNQGSWQTASAIRNSDKQTQFFKDAQALDRDEGREPRYWSTDVELLSRAFEAMLFDASKGGSPYLVGPSVADGYVTKKNGYGGTTYPAGKERPNLNEVYKQMLTQIDPETLEVKTYKMDTKIVEIEDLGYAVLDQYNLDSGINGGLVWFKTEEEAKRIKAARDGQDRVLTPEAMQMSKVNQHIIDMAKRIDGIMEEMGLFKWPEIKNGSMAESMFYHMRQGWWPKNNRELAEYGIKAYLQKPELLGFNPLKDQREIEKYKIADFEGDRVKLKQTQEDFEAAATRYVSQIITDMRAQGSDTKAIYDYIVNLYQNQPTLDVQSVLSKSNNAYSTPLPIGYLAGMLARVKSTTTVLDPTGGNGMLVVAANPQNVTTIELDPHRAENMRLMQIGTVIDGDAIEKIKDLRDQEVDVVMANPPFGALSTPDNVPSWNGQNYKIGTLDQAIAAKSLRAMANNGRAVLILGAHPKPGTITSTDRVFLNWLYGNYNVASHFEIAGNLYRKQGASWPLRVLVIAGRNQTDNVYPIDATVERVTTFDELWSKYVQANDSSEQVVVGTGKKQSVTGGANRPAGGVPAGGALEDGGAGAGVGTGAGVDVGEQLPDTGRVAGAPTAGGRGTSGGAGAPEQQPAGGKGKRGGPSGVQAGGAQGGGTGGEGSGAELGGLSDLDLDNIFDELGKPEKVKGAPRAPRAPKGTAAPRAPKGPAVKTPTVIPKELEGLGLESLLDELDAALNGTPTEVPKEVTPENSPERLDKQVDEAMGRIAQDTKNTSDDPNSGMYSRKDDQEYANVQPIIQKVWNAVGEKITDVAQRIKQVYALLVTKFGDPIKAHLRTFVDSLRTQVQRRPKNQTPVQAEPIDTESRVVYLGKSRFSSDGIYLPRAQSQHAYSALESLEAQVGNIDEFVAEELGYPSVEKMAKGLAGYQIDGLALAIQANKLGKGFIIGDDTGVGKGRAAAAMIVWAKKNGKIPIFVTLSDSLYTAMYEDLSNIGHEDIQIGMTNNQASISKNMGGGKIKTVFENKGKAGPELMSYIKKNGELPKGMDVLFTSYSQLNGGTGSAPRQDAIASLVAAGKAVLIMDEAHNAAGVPTNPESKGQNAFFMSLLTGINLLGKDVETPEDWKPPSAVYLSATFAKRPDNMPLYIHTNLRYAANTPEELTLLFGKGVKTDVLQQVSSEMLVESGSMLRRERSYEGVSMDFVTDDENAPRDIREVDKVTVILRALVNADRALKEWAKDPQSQAEIINKLGPPGSMLGKEGPTAFAEAKGNPFTSVVHNYIGTLLLSAKTQTAVDMVVDKMNNGEKVVVGLQNTNGSALDDFVAKNGIKIGDEIPNFGWQTLLQRAIDSTRRITLKSATGNPKDNIKVEIPYSMMPPSVRAGYDNLADMIKDFQSDLPVAPIDYMRTELEGKYVWTMDNKTVVGNEPPPGVKARRLVVREITGRNTAVDYSGDTPKYMALDNPERVKMISSFQNGEDSENGPIDVLIINSAGATGISLHASVEAFDQRPRHMIVLQPHGDISVFIQLLGRIHRTGQVEWPSFTMLATGIPAERRILAMLRKKLSSLKSNTSGGSSSTKVNGVDFINRYGDVATAEYLNEHADIRAFLAQPSFADPAEAAGTDSVSYTHLRAHETG
jgi:hypothetical protein